MLFRETYRHILLPLGFVLLLLLSSCSQKVSPTQRKANEKEYDSVSTAGLLIEAKKQQLLGNHKQASELYDKLIKLNPEDPVPHYELARMHRMYKRYDQGLQHILKATATDPQNKWYWLLQAELYFDLMQFENSAEAYARVIELFPQNPDFYLHYASAQVHAGQYKEAIKTYNEVEQQFGINEDVSFQKYRLHLLNKDIDGAISEVEALIESSPFEIRYYGALAELYNDLKRYDEARALFTKMKEIDPGNPLVDLALSEHFERSGKVDSASYYLYTAFSNPRLDIDTKMQVLLDMYGQGEDVSAEAYRLLDTLTTVHPKEAKAWSIYGDFLVRDERITEAREAFRKVVSLDSLRYPVWEQLLLLNSKLDDFGAMVEDGSSANRLFPEQPIPYLLKGAGQVRLKDYEGAVKTLNRGLYFVANETLEAQFLTYLAEAYYRNGDLTKAFRQYDRILEIDPKNSIILNNYSYQLAEADQDLEKAEQMSARAVELDGNNSSNLDTRAWVLFKIKNYASALEYIDKAIAVSGSQNAVILEHKGDILFHLNKNDEAIQWWQRARQAGEGSDMLDEKIRQGKYVE